MGKAIDLTLREAKLLQSARVLAATGDVETVQAVLGTRSWITPTHTSPWTRRQFGELSSWRYESPCICLAYAWRGC